MRSAAVRNGSGAFWILSVGSCDLLFGYLRRARRVLVTIMERQKLLQTLEAIEVLLSHTGHEDKAQWLSRQRAIVQSGAVSERRFALAEIRSRLSGMGSLSDLPLLADSETELTPEEARALLLDLLDQLYEQIQLMVGQG
jgi:hypothetical protein